MNAPDLPDRIKAGSLWRRREYPVIFTGITDVLFEPDGDPAGANSYSNISIRQRDHRCS